METTAGDIPVLLSWSGGKDSCFALYETQMTPGHRVAALLTTLTRDFDRISMHGVRRELLEEQAASLGLPLHKVFISKDASNDEYEMKMAEAFETYREQGIDSIVFGDLFLADIRAYREQFLARHKMHGLFPVWKRETSDFIREFIKLGFRTIVTCVNSDVLDESFVGKYIDGAFLSSLPEGVDPCGENGEFHTFVFDGPIFARPIEFSLGEIVLRESFWFCDLVPKMSTSKTAPGADNSTLIEDLDYYSEGAAIVFTARYLLRRGYCCESGCRHCPYTEVVEMNPRSNPSLD